MKYNIIPLILLLISSGAYAETFNDSQNKTKDNFFLLNSKTTKNLHYFFEKQLQPKAKQAVATASTGIGLYLLCDALKTAIDLQGQPQQNKAKGITLNAVIAASFICLGSYFFKQVWDENEKKPE